MSETRGRFPAWLKRRVGGGGVFTHTQKTLEQLGLETICTNANCPNRGDCWGRGTATVLILGNICTRNCHFCSVGHGKPLPPDPTEPARVSALARQLHLKYLVITSVGRDDLPDGGAAHFCDVIQFCRQENSEIQFELLVPDFRGCQDKALELLSNARPFVFGHNLETVPRLYPTARPGGDYARSLTLLKKAKDRWPETPTKSSLMLGLGETEEEVLQVLQDLRSVGCNRLALGQYLKPDKNCLDVVEFIPPEKFDWWAYQARRMGFDWVQSSPFTRSSYHAECSL